MTDYRWKTFIALVLVIFLPLGCSGCDEETGIDVDCPGDEGCTLCEAQADCDEDTYCDTEAGICVPTECSPGESLCEDGGVITCDSLGSGFGDPVACSTGVCQGGECGCGDVDDCAPGHQCTGGSCVCPSAVTCGGDGTCCGDGEICAEVAICDDDDENCETLSICRPECEGSVCGLTGDLCCEGDTPNCGPDGQCAPSCDGLGELCGEDFDECCDAGDLCVFGSCRTPGDSCQDFTDCDWGEYCDTGIQRCMPDDFPDEIECRGEGEFLEMEVTEKWSWTDNDIISIPVVGDVTGDGEPNVVVNTTRLDGSNWQLGDIVILDSAGELVHRVPHDPDNDSWGSQGRSNIALADVTGDGVMDIVYAGRGNPSAIVAINGQGETLWRSRYANGELATGTVQNGAVTVANFDGDPSRAQLVVGAMLIDSDGLTVWNENGDGPRFGTNDGYTGGVAVVADLTGDGKHEIITGKHAWTVDWQPAADPQDPPDVTVEILWEHDGPDGYPAVADFDGNGLPEVVLVASQTVRILNGQTGELWCGIDPTDQECDDDDSLRTQPILIPGPSNNNRGGPPTVADFDNDGRPEIGVAGGHHYAVFDINRSAFGDDNTPEEIDLDLLAEHEQAEPEDGELFIRWKKEIRDLSSNATGSSVFDFQGDGSASVIYSDECFMRVYSGVNGETELEIMNSTGTILEYPLVVDVDGNGRSEILVVANDIDHCSGFVDDYVTRRGLYVYEDPNDRWVRTRSVWNQHAYSIDNILDNGSVPDVQAHSWATHNTFRANRQGEIPLNAPDVVISSVQANQLACPPDIDFQVTIRNNGMSAIPSGLPVSIFDADTNQILETINIAQPISPGGTVVVSFSYTVPQSRFNQELNFVFVANEDGSSAPLVQDCNPETATAVVEPLQCRITL